MWCRRVSITDAACLRWRTPQQTLQRRWASSSSSGSGSGSSGGQRSNFRAGAVNPTPYQIKPNFSVPVWQPPARFMKYRTVRWLSNNLLALATYQLALEGVFTILFGSLLYAGAITAEGVHDTLQRLHYPLMSWIDLEGGVYTEPVVIGPFRLNPQKMTALHMGHNIANGLLPVQVALMLSTFSPMQRVYRSLRNLPPATVAATAAGADASLGKAASTSAAAGGNGAGANAVRRASYARASARTSTPRQPF